MNDTVQQKLKELEDFLPKGVADAIYWVYSQENQGAWARKTTISVWLVPNANKGQMLEDGKVGSRLEDHSDHNVRQHW